MTTAVQDAPRPAAGAAAGIGRTWGLLLALPLIFFGPALLPGKGFLPQHPVSLAPLSAEQPGAAAEAREGINYWTADGLFPFLTDALHLRRALELDCLPTWNPHLGLGYGSAGGSLVSPWYPPNLLHFCIHPARAFGWLALAHLVLLGTGAALFLRRQGLGLGSALLAGWAIQAGGLSVFGAHYGMKLAALAWFPWCLLAAQGVMARVPGAGLRLCVFTALSFLAGFPPVAIFILGSLALVGLSWSKGQAGRFAALTGFLILGVAAAGVGLLPMAESLQGAERTLRSGAYFAQTAPLQSLGTLLAPGLFGLPSDPFFAPAHPLALWLCSPDSLPRTLQANGLEWNLHVGLAVFLLALSGVCAQPRRCLMPGALLLLGLGFGLGWAPMSWLRDLPGLGSGSPTRAFLLTPLFWVWLAALGLESLARGSRRGALGLALGCSLALGLGLYLGQEAQALGSQEATSLLAQHYGVDLQTAQGHLAGADLGRAAQRLESEGHWLLGWTLAVALAGLATWRTGRRKAPAAGAAAWALLPWFLLVGGEGWRLSRASHRPVDLEVGLFPPSPALQAVRAATGTGRVLRLDRSASGVSEVERLARPNLLQAYGIGDLTPYVVFTPANWVDALAQIDPLSGYRSGASRISDPSYLDHPLLDVMNVTCILATVPIDHPRLEHVFGQEGFHVHRRELGDQGPFAVFPDSGGQPTEDAGLLFPPLVDAPDAAPGWSAGEVRWARPTPTRLDVKITGTGGGWLVMDGSFQPGWKATVNGVDATIVRAQGLLRAVRIPAGEVTVRTHYEPWSLRLGALLTVLALAIAWRTSRVGTH